MRIAILCTATTLHQQGGTEVHAETLAAGAAAKGHRVHIVTTHHPDRPELEIRGGVATHYLPGTDFSMSRKTMPAWWELSSRKVRELSSGEGLDIIWAENYTGQYYAKRFRRETGVPVISFINGLGVLDDIKSNFTHISTPADAFRFAAYLAQAAAYWWPWQYNTARYSDHLVAISQAARQAIRSEVHIPEDRITAVYPPVDTGLFRPDRALREQYRNELGLAPADRVLLMSGVAHRQKGFDIGIKAFSALKVAFPELKMIIAGDGPERGRLEKMAALLGRKSVIFTGTVPNFKMPGVYNAADVYVNPTMRREGLAIVNAEAMACALPCVSSRTGGTAETIEDGISGFFTKPGQNTEITQRTLKILQTPRLAGEMGANARKRAVDFFAADKIMAAILDISIKVIKKAGSAA